MLVSTHCLSVFAPCALAVYWGYTFPVCQHTHTHTHTHTHNIHAGGGGGGVKPSSKAQPPNQKTFEREVNAILTEIREKQAKLVCSRVVLGRECEPGQCWSHPSSHPLTWRNRLVTMDRTKTRNGAGNGSKNGSIKLNICNPSGHGKSFHGHGLTSALVTRNSMQASPPARPCAAC